MHRGEYYIDDRLYGSLNDYGFMVTVVLINGQGLLVPPVDRNIIDAIAEIIDVKVETVRRVGNKVFGYTAQGMRSRMH